MILVKGENALDVEIQNKLGKESLNRMFSRGNGLFQCYLYSPKLVFRPQNAENVFRVLMQNNICWKHVYQLIGSV